jgi:ABC-type multidrug transport system fused ATPase/permease subunit
MVITTANISNQVYFTYQLILTNYCVITVYKEVEVERQMVDKGKLSLWDLWTYLVSGFFSSILVAIYVIYYLQFDLSAALSIIKNISSILLILLPLVFLCIGMLLEPIANIFEKTIKKLSFFPRKNNQRLESVKDIIKKLVPDTIDDRMLYRYCKSVVELKSSTSNADLFLARFGLYRNLSFLSFLCIIANLVFFNITWASSLLSVSLLAFVVLTMRRATEFLRHMESAIYYHFIALHYDKTS